MDKNRDLWRFIFILDLMEFKSDWTIQCDWSLFLEPHDKVDWFLNASFQLQLCTNYVLVYEPVHVNHCENGPVLLVFNLCDANHINNRNVSVSWCATLSFIFLGGIIMRSVVISQNNGVQHCVKNDRTIVSHAWTCLIKPVVAEELNYTTRIIQLYIIQQGPVTVTLLPLFSIFYQLRRQTVKSPPTHI